MASIQKQHVEKKGRKRFKKLFSQIRGQVSVWDIFVQDSCIYHNTLVIMQKYFFTKIFFSYACREPQLVSHETASSSAKCSWDKPPFSFVRGQDLTMWDVVWVLPQGNRSLSAPKWTCDMGVCTRHDRYFGSW